jgi:hypothetical protein
MFDWHAQVALSACRALAATVCNPLELIKVRMQSRGSRQVGAWRVFRSVVAADGIRGLWKGTAPSAVRIVALEAAFDVTYMVNLLLDAKRYSAGQQIHAACALVLLLRGPAAAPVPGGNPHGEPVRDVR